METLYLYNCYVARWNFRNITMGIFHLYSIFWILGGVQKKKKFGCEVTYAKKTYHRIQKIFYILHIKRIPFLIQETDDKLTRSSKLKYQDINFCIHQLRTLKSNKIENWNHEIQPNQGYHSPAKLSGQTVPLKNGGELCVNSGRISESLYSEIIDAGKISSHTLFV